MTDKLKEKTLFADKARSVIEKRAGMRKSEYKAYVCTFGCQQNEADSEKIMGMCIEMGYVKCSCAEDADLIIFNTCAVREHAELKALSRTGQLKHLKEKNPDLIIGLWGCMVTQEHRRDNVKFSYPYVNFVGGTNKLHRLCEIVYTCLESSKRQYFVDDEPHEIVEGLPTERQSDLKAYVSIMYGCNNFCTYCVVPYVRGRERSRHPDEVLAEVKSLVEKGYKDITLLGQNVNSYCGGDEKMPFYELLDKCASFEGEYRVRFMTSHPKDASDELCRVMAQNKNVAKHFHLPVQSGSTEILKRMNRRYTKEKYLALAEKIKSIVPGVSLTTDIIVGFPGETESDFEETLDVIKSVRFDSIFSFIYSPRKGTPASEMENKVPKEVCKKRFARLIETASAISGSLDMSYCTKTERVLVDSHIQDGVVSAKTSSNKTVKFEYTDDSLYGRFVDVKIEGFSPAGLLGSLCE